MQNSSSPSSSKTILLFDSNHYVHRAYHALPPLTTKQGEAVGAVFGFLKTIIKLLKKFDPVYFAVCWDSRPTDRLALDSSYKANRPPAPPDLSSQIALAQEMVQAWGLPTVKMEGQEADDLIATLAAWAHKATINVTICSSDKDLLQLVKPGVSFYLEHKDEWIDGEAIRKKYGVSTPYLIDYFALTGDATDNIRGLPGVGPKTAQKLIAEFGHIGDLLGQAKRSSPAMADKLRTVIISNEERLNTNIGLLKLKEDLSLDCTPEKFTVKKTIAPEFATLLMRAGFASILNDFRQMGWIAQDLGGEIRQKRGPQAERPAKETGEGMRDKTREQVIELDNAPEGNAHIDEAISNPGCVKIVYDWKETLRAHPEWARNLKGALLDVKLLAWLSDSSEESYQKEWLLNKYQRQSVGDLALLLKDKIAEYGLWGLYESCELPLARILYEMEKAGIAVDPGILKILSRQWLRSLETLRAQFIEASGAGQDLNLNSPKQLAHLLFDKLGLPATKKTKTGYSTNEEVLHKLTPLHPAVGFLLDYRELAKLHSTYIEGLLSSIDPKSGRIHARFHQEGTQTGRLSCSNPNLQNIPVRSERGLEIRRAFVPAEPSWDLLSLDYSQIDLRVFAHLSEDERLIQFFREGRDIHEETARALLAGPDEPVTGPMRRQAKAINFGILYGMGSWGLGETLQLSQDEARLFIERYFERFPKVAAWREKTIENARDAGWVTTIAGRRRILPFINSTRRDLREFSERAAVNTPVQGSSADIIKAAMIGLSRYVEKHGLLSRLILQIHDEILIEGPSEEIASHQQEFKRVMEEAFEIKVPLVVHLKKGKNWADL